MKHKHDYEPVYHPSLAPGARELGIKAAEIRKCKTCQKEMPFVLVKDDWFPLFEDREYDERDILMA
jgi:hypothetical protein